MKFFSEIYVQTLQFENKYIEVEFKCIKIKMNSTHGFFLSAAKFWDF